MKNMKKIFLSVLVLGMSLVLVACNSEKEAISETGVKASTLEIEKDPLIAAYCSGEWDGNFIYDGEHCASIKDGELWIDCQKISYKIPDMGIYEESIWFAAISSDSTGTWIHDLQFNTVELWKHGTRLKRFTLRSEQAYYTYVYKLENCLVARYGQNLWIYDLEGKSVYNANDIIDCYQVDSEILCSNFEHKNFRIMPDGSVEELFSSYIRFPRKQVAIEESSSIILQEAENLLASGWDGSCRKIDNDFIFVDFYGDVIINNQFAGNVAMGKFVPTNRYGANIYTSKESSYFLDGENLVIFKEGIQRKIDISDGNGQILWVSENGLVIKVYGEKVDTLIIVRPDEDDIKIVSTNVIDANVAYDTLYYMEGDVVYSLDWTDENAKPQVFFEGAYAVSSHTDEAEGAIVPIDMANYQGYGDNNLYSSYGE